MRSSTAITSSDSSRTERRRARNRDALVNAARRLFARDGFQSTTIAGITEQADLGFGTFYRYFPDKEAILDAVLDVAKIELDEVLSHPDNDTAAPPAALTGLTARFAQAVRRNHDLLALVWQVGIRSETGGERVRPDRLPPARALPVLVGDVIRRIIERGVASGEFLPVDANVASRFIASGHMYLFSPAALAVDEPKLIAELCALELRALSGTGKGATRAATGG